MCDPLASRESVARVVELRESDKRSRRHVRSSAWKTCKRETFEAPFDKLRVTQTLRFRRLPIPMARRSLLFVTPCSAIGLWDQSLRIHKEPSTRLAY